MITKKLFGNTKSGDEVFVYTLTNDKVEIQIINFGGAIVSFKVPDKNNKILDIVLGYDDLETYETEDKYLGALVGRCANRIKNGKLELNGQTYDLYCNNGSNHLHGGKIGFNKKVWKSEIQNDSLVLSYLSKDGEENYSGNLEVCVTYSLDKDNNFTIDYKAKTDKDTLCNLTNHSYFNLAGHDSGTILNQKLQLFCDSYTVFDEQSLPTGEIASVHNTPLDFTKLTAIGERIDDNFNQLQYAGGYDHNFVVSDYDGTLKKVACACDENTDITLEVFTTLPGLQFYTGNYLDDTPIGKGNTKYYKRCGFCIETQYFPDAINHKNFLQPILKANEEYHHITKFHVSLK